MVNCLGEHKPVGVYLVFMTSFLLFMCAWKNQRNAEIGCFNFIYVLVLLGLELRVLYWLNICTTTGLVIPPTLFLLSVLKPDRNQFV